jgi:hypothetical protein
MHSYTHQLLEIMRQQDRLLCWILVLLTSISLIAGVEPTEEPEVMDAPEKPPEVVLQEAAPAAPSAPTVRTGPALPAQPNPPMFMAAEDNLEQDRVRWAEDRARSAEARTEASDRTVSVLLAVCLFGFPAAFVSGVYFARYKSYQQLNQTVRTLLETGVTVPPVLLSPTMARGPAWSDLRKGILLIWLGVGAMFLLAILFRGTNASSLGLVPVFTGGAYLLLWLMDRRKLAS